MAANKNKKTAWVAPRSGGYAAKSPTSSEVAQRSSLNNRSERHQQNPLPPGPGSAAKAKS